MAGLGEWGRREREREKGKEKRGKRKDKREKRKRERERGIKKRKLPESRRLATKRRMLFPPTTVKGWGGGGTWTCLWNGAHGDMQQKNRVISVRVDVFQQVLLVFRLWEVDTDGKLFKQVFHQGCRKPLRIHVVAPTVARVLLALIAGPVS